MPPKTASALQQTAFPAIGIAIVLAMLTAVVCAGVVRNDYVNLDDPDYIGNPHLQAGLTWDSVKWAFTTWHPLTWLSFLVERQLWGTHANVSHGINLFLHATNVALVFLWLNQLTGARWRSAVIALLFALHPQQMEAVAWVAERKGLLSASFGLLALLAYTAYAKARGERQGARGTVESRGAKVEGREFRLQGPRAKVWYGAALVCFVAALLSKPIWLAMPLLLLTLDYWPLGQVTAGDGRWKMEGGKKWLRLGVEKIPFLVLSLAAAGLTTRFQQQAGALQTLTDHSMGMRLMDAAAAVGHYGQTICWPRHLAVPYPREVTADPLLALGGVALLLAGLGIGWGVRKRFPVLLLGGLWFFGLLFPVLGLFQVGAQTVADRYAYLPSLGVFLVLIWLGHALFEHWHVPIAGRVCIPALMLGALAFQTQQQISHWKNSETLFTNAVTVTPNNWLAHYNLASEYDRQGRTNEALQHYQTAARIKPNYAEAHNNLGVLLAKQQRYAEAIAAFQAALLARPSFIEVRRNMAQTYLNQAKELSSAGQTAEARQVLERAISAAPEHAEAHLALGTLLARTGDLAAAVPELETAVRLKPENAMAHFTLGKVLANQGKIEAARAQFQEALHWKPDATPILQALQNLPASGGPP